MLPTGGVLLRGFERGRLIDDNGRRLRVFEAGARSITLNGRIPGPTLCARESERIRVVCRNGDSTSHSLHVVGGHPAVMGFTSPRWMASKRCCGGKVPSTNSIFPVLASTRTTVMWRR